MLYHVTYCYNGRVCLEGNSTKALAMALVDHVGDLIVGRETRAEYERAKAECHDWLFGSDHASGASHILLVRADDNTAYAVKIERR